MKILNTMKADVREKNVAYNAYLIFAMLLLLWLITPRFIGIYDQTAGYIDPSVWMLILLGLISFLIIVGLCWWLVQQFWLVLGLPALGNMVLQFKGLELWQQLGFYWASFALLLLAGVMCLMAIC